MGIDGTELSQAIAAIRNGLTAAQAEGAGAPIRFAVKEITLDLGIELRSTTTAGGSVKAFVVSGEARGERAHANTHRLTVRLEADETAGPLQISDTDEDAWSEPGQPG